MKCKLLFSTRAVNRFLLAILLALFAQNVLGAKADTTVDKTKAPVIYKIIVDFDNEKLILTGFNFMPDTVDPIIYMGDDPTPLTITSATDTSLTVNFPSEIPEGDYMLLIENSDNEQIGHDLTIDRELSETEVITYVDGNGYIPGPHYSNADVDAFLAARFTSLDETIAGLQSDLTAQQEQIVALQSDLATAQAAIASLEAGSSSLLTQFTSHSANNSAHHTRYADAEAIVAVGPHFSGNHADLTNVTSNQHHADVADNPVFDLEPFVRVETGTINAVSGPHILFEGANVHVRSGSGSTDDGGTGDYLGLGNLIVGYNEYCCGDRSGSHNVVIGTSHQFTSYAGFVAGHRNQLHAKAGSIAGGYENTVEGTYTSVLGGHFNRAIDLASTASGGVLNVSSGQFTSILGGTRNTASGTFSSISGGQYNQATGFYSSVVGGQNNWAGGHASSVLGGDGNQAPTNLQIISGLEAPFSAHTVDAAAHHNRYEDGEALAAVGPHFSGNHDDLTNISLDQHHARYTDSEALIAVGPHYSDADALAAVGPHFSGDHADLVNVTSDQHHANLAGNPIFDLAPYVSVDPDEYEGMAGPHVVFDGVNVHVRNGLAAPSWQKNGLGNLVIGYNEISDPEDVYVRIGSHNLVVGHDLGFSGTNSIVSGVQNRVSTYSAVLGGCCNTESGGHSVILGGIGNSATGDFSSVIGGAQNAASGYGGSVFGGSNNTAIGPGGTVAGGRYNTASGDNSSVSGGRFNEASGIWASVSAGQYNLASGASASVSGGAGNTASSNATSVSGGTNNLASGDHSSVTGGDANTAVGNYASVNGGSLNLASGLYASVTGGKQNIPSGDWGSVTGGFNNQATLNYASVSGGANNIAGNLYASVSGGGTNVASGQHSWVGGGENNEASGIGSGISGGKDNLAAGWVASVTGGSQNQANGNASTVTGGDVNHADGFWSVVSGGRSRTASAVDSWVAVDVMPRLANVEANFTTLQSNFGTHTGDITAHHTRYEDGEAIAAVGPHYTDADALLAVDGQFISLDTRVSTAEANLSALQTRPIFDLEPFVTVTDIPLDAMSGPHILFEGANIHIRSGSGSTDDGGTGDYLGLGNLVIGYNEYCCGGRTGSHNVVIGTLHQYTSYGGFVAGHRNQLHAEAGSICGGYENTVEGRFTSVLGGHFNTATVLATSISGGLGNLSSNHFSSICGGYQNETHGPTSAIGGGAFRTVYGDRDWAAGALFQDE